MKNETFTILILSFSMFNVSKIVENCLLCIRLSEIGIRIFILNLKKLKYEKEFLIASIGI
jgi:hypothetical protein